MMILLHSALVGPQSCASVSPGNHVLKETLKRKNPEWSSNDAEGSLEGTEEKERSLRRHVSPIPKHRVDWIVRDMVFCVLLQKEELRSESRSLKRRFSYRVILTLPLPFAALGSMLTIRPSQNVRDNLLSVKRPGTPHSCRILKQLFSKVCSNSHISNAWLNHGSNLPPYAPPRL